MFRLCNCSTINGSLQLDLVGVLLSQIAVIIKLMSTPPYATPLNQME